MCLHCACVSILRAGKENGYADCASILGPALARERSADAPPPGLTKAEHGGFRKSLSYECRTRACNSLLLARILVESGHPFQTCAPMRLLFTSKIVEHSRNLPVAPLGIGLRST
jgi:hypothetical protein